MSGATASGVPALPTGNQLHRRYQWLTARSSVISLGLISGYLVALLSLAPSQWRTFALFVAVMAPAFTLAQWIWVDPRKWRPMRAYLDAKPEGEGPSEALCHEAFAAVVHFPQYTFFWGIFWYSLGGVLLSLWLWHFEGITSYSALVITCAAVTGGFVGILFHTFATKTLLRPVREALATEIGDVDVRQDLVRPLSLRVKLIASVTSVTLVVVLFAIFLAQVRASRGLEAFTVRHQAIALARIAPEAPGSVEQIAVSEEMAVLGAGYAIVDATGSRIVDGSRDGLTRFELSALRGLAALQPAGDSRSFDSPNAFAFRRMDDGRILVAFSPRRTNADMWFVFGLLVLVASGIALSLGVVLSRDICAGAEVVRAALARVADGDLSAGPIYESEDELGDLARGFERMAGFLRTAVGSLAVAADRVEHAAAEFASVGDAVAGVTADQREGVHEAGESMERIRREVQGIAQSAQSLNTFMEESSSSVAELGAVGEELSQNASVLSAKVEDSSASVEEMIRSVSEVAQNAEGLHEAASETSSSMEEMATSMREVEANASETARFSSQVAAMADQGRERVRQTIDGMYAIREATETAHSVIVSLGDRVNEIGAVVEVIDDVADETNLLALNAAIIAAQAGDHGRSFSVVADEIKELADRVLASTKEIGAQIRSVQRESTNAVGAISRGSESVQSGVDLSAEAGVALEQITDAARGAGDRITEIVAAMREQSKASGHVVELMDRVRTGVEQIRVAGQEQSRSNQVVLESCTTMREISEQVRSTTAEQSRGSRRIGESVESVRDAVEQINRSLQEQSSACGQVAEVLSRVSERTVANQQSTERMREAMRGLVQQAETLRDGVRRFRL